MTLVHRQVAAVAIDMHRGHLDPPVATMPLTTERSRRIISRTAQFFAGLRRRAVPVIHVITAYRDPGEILSNPFWRAKADDPGATRRNVSRHNVLPSVGTEIMPELLDVPYDRVIATKKRYSCFVGTDLEIILRSLGVQTVFFAGVNTNSCILATAIEACNRDFRAVVVEDCVDSMDGEQAHRAALFLIKTAFGWVANSESILMELQTQPVSVAQE